MLRALRQARKNAESNDISMGLRLQSSKTYLPRAPVRTPLVYDSRTATVTIIAVNLVSANGALSRIVVLTVGREEASSSTPRQVGPSYPRAVKFIVGGGAVAINLKTRWVTVLDVQHVIHPHHTYSAIARSSIRGCWFSSLRVPQQNGRY